MRFMYTAQQYITYVDVSRVELNYTLSVKFVLLHQLKSMSFITDFIKFCHKFFFLPVKAVTFTPVRWCKYQLPTGPQIRNHLSRSISLHSYLVPLVQWSTHMLPVMRDPGSIPRGYLSETGIILLALSCYTSILDIKYFICHGH